MENVTFSEEQFGKLIEAIRPSVGSIAPAEYKPEDDSVTRQLAGEVLQTVSRGYYPSSLEKDCPKYVELKSKLLALVKEYI